MESLVYDIKEDEILLDDYSNMDCVKEIVIFEEWVEDDGVLGNWARRQMGSKKWNKQRGINISKKWWILSK